MCGHLLRNTAGDTADIDDAGRVFRIPRTFEQGQASACKVKESLDVQVHHLIESPVGFLVGIPFERFSPRCASVIDENMKLIIEKLCGMLCERFASLSVGNIGGHIVAIQCFGSFLTSFFGT